MQTNLSTYLLSGMINLNQFASDSFAGARTQLQQQSSPSAFAPNASSSVPSITSNFTSSYHPMATSITHMQQERGLLSVIVLYFIMRHTSQLFVCLYVYCVCMYVCMYVCVYVMYVCMYVCMCVCYVCMYVYMLCMYVCMYVLCMYVMYVCMYVCMSINQLTNELVCKIIMIM